MISRPNYPTSWQTLSVAENHSVTPLHRPCVKPSSPQTTAETFQSFYQSCLEQLQASQNAHQGLLKLTHALGDFFQSQCWIGTLDQQGNIPQSTYWDSHSSTTWIYQPTDLSILSRHTATLSGDRLLEPIATPDLHISHPEVALELSEKQVNASLSRTNIRAVLTIHTNFQGNINGIIALTRSQPHSWTESDMQSLKTLSTCVAISISQMQLEQHTQQQIHYQTLLDQLAIASRSACNLDQIFQLALKGTVDVMQVTRGFVLLLKYNEPLLKNRSSEWSKAKSPTARLTVESQYPLTCELSNQTLRGIIPPERELSRPTAETIAIKDASMGTWLKASFQVLEEEINQCIVINGSSSMVLPTLHPATMSEAVPPASTSFQGSSSGLAAILNPELMPSLLLMPLESQGVILGCLILQHEHLRVWNPQEIGFVKLVAAQVSTAMIQTQTLRQVQSLVDERTAQLRKSLDVQAKLYEKTRQQVDQLRRLNQIMEEFVSTISHELRTPLTSMTLAIRMLRQAGLSPEQRAKYLDILEQQCLQETNLINDLLALQKIEAGSTASQFQLIDIRYLIQGVTQSFEELWAKKQLKLDVEMPDYPLKLWTDSDSLHRILSELLTNAGKYGEVGSQVRLSVTHSIEQQVSQLQFSLSNVGAGITPEEMPYIFDKFRRGRGVTQQAVPGTGLGLALVKGLVEHLSGAIAISSHPLGHNELWETCLTMTLPQLPDSPLT
ncbi:GAF domain-containing sensor histidine kinase [Oscillatoria sp. FACHB-1407]|uniref:GAF domain-containing sensor histidine kinase n=1 Tax=Oscillatoria sp. FACHB-1407 TaxID=2692847 RepID=UPI00168426B5|nr:GAF domain-containing sensor histidine kinase [Oscillatoria sp. FACHB-1407]MBD2464415.1 GAF domain-containing sensor histidine kinase [Oscillatoria sp. FACHB-1407]